MCKEFRHGLPTPVGSVLGLRKLPNVRADGRACNVLWMIWANFISQSHCKDSNPRPLVPQPSTRRYLQEEKNTGMSIRFGKWHTVESRGVGGPAAVEDFQGTMTWGWARLYGCIQPSKGHQCSYEEQINIRGSNSAHAVEETQGPTPPPLALLTPVEDVLANGSHSVQI